MISAEALARFIGETAKTPSTASNRVAFDMQAYLSKCGLEITRQKPWQSHPGGTIFEVARCPFNLDHTSGSAAFTVKDGEPGFCCKHNGCQGKTIKDVFAIHPIGLPPEVSVSEEDSKVSPESTEEAERKNQAQLLLELAEAAELFRTPQGDAYARIPVDEHNETWTLRSKNFKRWLIKRFFVRFRKPPASKAFEDALGVLEAQGQFDGPEMPVFTRVAEHGDSIYLDLCNSSWEAVEINAHGWKVVANPPVRFRRAKGMQALPHPVRGGSIDLLRNLVNIGDAHNRVLCACWLVNSWRPRGPYPALILVGEQGSAKSTTARILRKIIDPSIAPIRTTPRDERDLLIAATNSWVLAYDNLSGIPQWLSDALCRIATGGGFSTRELYTDADEVLFDAMRPLLLNGIEHLAERPDLADRALILNIPRISGGRRREESELYKEFDDAHPKILGALLDALSWAIARFPETRLEVKPRMADFAVWATAAEEGLGFHRGAFMNAYITNRDDAVAETLEGDLVGSAIRTLVEQNDQNGNETWMGSCQELLNKLELLVDERAKKSPKWPKTPRGLSGQLRRLITFLRETGIDLVFPPKGAKGQRSLIITRITGHSTAATATSATPESNRSPDQSSWTPLEGGGTDRQVAHEGVLGKQSRHGLLHGNSSNACQDAERVAEVAVVNGAPLGSSSTERGSDSIYCCSTCGPVEWIWNGSAWACPECGVPAAGQQVGGTDVEHFEI